MVKFHFRIEVIEIFRDEHEPVRNITQFLNLWDAKKIEKIYAKEKTITQDNIYIIRQFAYIYKVTMIYYFMEKTQDATLQCFSLSTTRPTLI